jgi:hypothetical protein
MFLSLRGRRWRGGWDRRETFYRRHSSIEMPLVSVLHVVNDDAVVDHVKAVVDRSIGEALMSAECAINVTPTCRKRRSVLWARVLSRGR